MKRRDFLKGGMVSIAALSIGSLTGCAGSSPPYQGVDVRLRISGALAEMVDGRQVFMWAYEDLNQTNPALMGPRVPGPLIEVEEGYPLRFTITNDSSENHGFAIPGLVDLGVIGPGETRVRIVIAPTAGTYMYHDPLNAPVNRVLGLHGAMVVMPQSGTTPYSLPTASVQQLFDDLGTTAHFPRHALSPAGWQPERTRVWLLNQVDPTFNDLARQGTTINPADMKANFLPRYFTINGKSGVFAADDHSIALEGRIGQPMLVRVLNAGLFDHSTHLHANHFYITAVNNVVSDNVLFLDTISIYPEDRVDWLVPFIRPPDIAGDESIPLRTLIPNELALVLGDVPQSPLGYAMHCHVEMSQTAAGGNYPQGTVTHFGLLGDLDGVDFPHSGGM